MTKKFENEEKNDKSPYSLWYFWRLGFSIYLNLPTALTAYASIIYQAFFAAYPIYLIVPSFFLILAPLGVIAGYFHIRRSYALRREQEIATQQHPFSYKALPKEEVYYGAMRKQMELLTRLFEKENIFKDDAEKTEWNKTLVKFTALSEGKDVRGDNA